MKRIYIVILLFVQFTFGQTLTIDSSFNTGLGVDLWSGAGTITVDSVVQQPDNKIIVVGQYLTYNGISAKCIIRLNSDGTKDTSFDAGTGTNTGIWGCALQPDGKIIIHGGFTTYNGVTSPRIVRLNANGTKDTTFNIGTGPDDYIESMAIQPDGKIVIVGRFLNYNGVARNKIARLNANGTLDTSFAVATGADERIRDLVIQNDGKILIGGHFSNYDGVAKSKIVRLNSNGSVDSSYNVGTGASGNIWTMALQPDGKLIIGGEFQQYNGTARNRIARINTDGSLDTTFSIGTGVNGVVMSLYINSDGKVYFGGSYTTFNGVSRVNLARLNADGSLDTTLTIGTGFNDWVKSISKQSDNKLLIGGLFTSYNGVNKKRVVRMIDGTLANENFDFSQVTLYPNPVKSILNIENLDGFKTYTITTIDGRLIESNNSNDSQINVEHLKNGVYILTLITEETKIIKKFIKN